MGSVLDREVLRKTWMEKGEVVLDRLMTALGDATRRGRVDEVMREAVLQAGGDVLAEGLRQLGHGLRQEGDPPKCEACDKPMKFKQMRSVRVRTALDGRPRTVVSPYMKCTACGTGALWTRRALGLDKDGFTKALREMVVRAGALEPFET